MDIPNQYTLPTIDFVAGATQDFAFHCYFAGNNKPHDLSSCEANFAVVSFNNKMGTPHIRKKMDIVPGPNTAEGVHNTLNVTLEPEDTVGLPTAKYIYQITIRDITGDTEIPNQGIIYLINNIDKASIKKQ